MQRAERPEGQKSRKQKHYGKHISNLMKQYGLNREMTQDKELWKNMLAECFPTRSPEAEQTAAPENEDEPQTRSKEEGNNQENSSTDGEGSKSGIQT